MKSQPTNETGMALGLVLIAGLVALLLAALLSGEPGGRFGEDRRTILLGLYLIAWGGMFLASYRFAHKTFFFRALMRVCEQWSFPKGRGMALFYGALAILLGGTALLTGVGIVGSTR